MSADWDRVREAFEAVLAAPAAERDRKLLEESRGDEELRKELEALLAHDDEAGTFLSEPGQAPPLVSRQASLGAGARVGDYELVRPLGAGGMGAVWEARGERPRRTVALKLLRLGLFSERDVRRFEFEAEVLARLQHPGIAQVYASGTHDEGALAMPWFAMELVNDARDLTDYVEERELELVECLELFAEVCDAIAHAHARGVLHRDLKPANILVGADGRPRVIDFGIARLREEESQGDGPALTGEGQIIGTLQYMAPEQLSGAVGEVDTRADVYALGVLLCELSAGAAPYELGERSLAALLRTLLDDPPKRPTEIRPELPAEIDWIVLRALEKDRERRYASVVDLAGDVRRFLGDEPLLAGPPSGLYRARKFVARHRTLVTAAALVLVTLVVGATGIALSLARLATEHGRVQRLSDARRLDGLESAAELLFPPLPEIAGDLRAWIEDARDLAAGLAAHETVLEDLRTRATTAGAGGPSGLRFERVEDAWWHAAQSELVARLQAFADPDNGLLFDVQRRLEFALSVGERTVAGEHARASWAEAGRYAARPDGPYAGLELRPQLGLLPIGTDPSSGLLEFVHVLSGDVPQRDAAGQLARAATSGVVLVLLPGGTFTMGARPPSTEQPLGGPNVDAAAITQARWGPVHEVELAPFFLAKFETTRAQWWRAAGNSMDSTDGDNADGGSALPLAPIDHVSWFDVERVARELDLALPTEAQWEYGVRAGTTSPLWFGDAPDDWEGVAWVADSTAGARAREVGLLPPNPFGLHDLYGNVQEWCLDPFGGYGSSTRPGDGLRLVEGGTQRVLRGGFYHLPAESTALLSRSAARAMDSPTARYERLGVRWARSLR